MKQMVTGAIAVVLFLTGCERSPSDGQEKTDRELSRQAETFVDENTRIVGRLTPEQPVLMGDMVSIRVDEHFIEEDVSVSVTPVHGIPAPNGMSNLEITAFRFDVSGDYDGLFEITMTYEPGEYDIGAGYYNETTQTWESVFFTLDESGQQITILTDGFSTYGIFRIAQEGRRNAIFDGAYFKPFNHFVFDESVHGGIIKEALASGLHPGPKAISLVEDWVGEWMAFSGVVFDLESLTYESEFLGDLSDAFGNVGLAMSLARLAFDYSQGNQEAVAINAFNTVRDLAISKLATQAIKVSMLGVLAIDYSMEKLIAQVIGGRENVWYQAYALYYQKEQNRRPRDWYYRIREIYDHATSPDQFERMLEAELNNYTWLFWKQEDESWGVYQSEVMGQGWQLGGGLNEALKHEIADYNRNIILRDTLGPVFRRLEREIQREQFLSYLEEVENLRKQFNQIVTLDIEEVPTEHGPVYAGYGARFHPLSDNADKADWTGRLNEQGSATVQFTVIGHIAAGMPDQIRLYESIEAMNDERPSHSQEFTVDVPHTNVKIQQEMEVYQFRLQSWVVTQLMDFPRGGEPHGGAWNVDCAMAIKCVLTIERPREGSAGAVFIEGPRIRPDRRSRTEIAIALGTHQRKPGFVDIRSGSVSGRAVTFISGGGYPIDFRQVELEFDRNSVQGRIDVFRGRFEYGSYPDYEYVAEVVETVEFEGLMK